MRRFLVVGCGGSGGATLAYLMDQLRSDLAAAGVQSLPQGWQFVHIDVPSVSEGGPDGLGSVREQGGTYYGSGPQNGGYNVLDQVVSQRLAEHRALEHIATWAPRNPETVNAPISMGAGQYRAIGRMITLNRAREIRRTLETAWGKLSRVHTTTEMAGLSVPGLGRYDKDSPIVLVVSSMAGGAGASMALDVCRLLTLVHNVDPNLIGVFMVASNIFDTLPGAARTGVKPNALAMLGEIVASQTGAARDHDVAMLQALGQSSGVGVPIPFARVFPVGSFSGVERTQFGDGSPNAVYRGLGRGLAGLIMSESATTQFVSFDLGNRASPNGDRDLLGWGAEWANLAWGSYGFASLSMGRDRYAEYAAQRIARSCVERLLHGHTQRGSQASSTEQVAALLESQWQPVCERGLQLPALRVGPTQIDAELGGWLTTVAFPQAAVVTAARSVVDRKLRDYVPAPDGVQAVQWTYAVRAQLATSTRRAAVAGEANKEAATWAFRWHAALLDRTEWVVADAVARLGLPYAAALVERLSLHLREAVAPGVERLAALAAPDVSAIPPEMEQVLGTLRGVIRNRGLVDQLLSAYQEQVYNHIYAQSALLVKQLLLDLTVQVLGPLGRALNEAQRVLEIAVDTPVTDRGLARLATDQCADWPKDSEQRVPDRFDEADNEVLLTSSADFQRQYEADIRTALQTQNAPAFVDARNSVVGQVIVGVWQTTGGARPPGGLLERGAQWRSGVFPIHPETNEPFVPSMAQFDVHVRPAELLRRARAFVGRSGESFDSFCKLSIRDFVLGHSESESELRRREQEVEDKFVETLALSRPLTSVNSTALQALHRDSQIEYRYKFSEVPFAGLAIGPRLNRVLADDPKIDESSGKNLESAVGDSRGVTRIDVFGSYPNYSPLVFDAVLTPVAEQWAEIGEIGRESFWQWRRCRPLNAALPMSDSERRAMVAGWFLGQIVGQVGIPPAPYDQPVRIWDGEESRWVSFPHPLLTPPKRFLADYDWLPAVLESVLLAIARSHESPVMSSLRPYRLLRGLYDSSSQGPVGGIDLLSAEGVVADWLAKGCTASGGVSRVPDAEKASPDERAELAITWLTGIRDLAGGHFMASGRGSFSTVSKRNQASMTPMFRDLAPDVFSTTGELVVLLQKRPKAEEAVTIPKGGTF